MSEALEANSAKNAEVRERCQGCGGAAEFDHCIEPGKRLGKIGCGWWQLAPDLCPDHDECVGFSRTFRSVIHTTLPLHFTLDTCIEHQEQVCGHDQEGLHASLVLAYLRVLREDLIQTKDDGS